MVSKGESVSEKHLDVLIFLAAPFLVSGGFWLTPWLGWPTLFVLIPLWCGTVAGWGDVGRSRKAASGSSNTARSD